MGKNCRKDDEYLQDDLNGMSTRAFYEMECSEWAPAEHYFRYAGVWFEQAVLSRAISREGIVLDAGCGDGRLMEVIRKNHGQTMVGIDISRRQLTIAKKRLNDEKTHLIQASITHLPFKDDIFHHVVSWSVLIHVEKEECRMLGYKELKRVMERDGAMLLMLENYPSVVYQAASFLHRISLMLIGRSEGKKIDFLIFPFKKDVYGNLSGKKGDLLFLHRSSYFEMRNISSTLNLRIGWFMAQGFLLPDALDIYFDKLMRFEMIGRIMGYLDRILSRIFPFLSDHVVYLLEAEDERAETD